MKTILVLITLVFSSCQLPFLINTKGYSKQEMDLDKAWQTVSSFDYTTDDLQYLKSPFEFFDKKEGNCKDFAVSLVYLLGPKASLVIVELNEGTVYHAIVKYKGRYLEPQRYNIYYDEPYDFTIYNTYDYYSVMEVTTLLGTKSL